MIDIRSDHIIGLYRYIPFQQTRNKLLEQQEKKSAFSVYYVSIIQCCQASVPASAKLNLQSWCTHTKLLCYGNYTIQADVDDDDDGDDFYEPGRNTCGHALIDGEKARSAKPLITCPG